MRFNFRASAKHQCLIDFPYPQMVLLVALLTCVNTPRPASAVLIISGSPAYDQNTTTGFRGGIAYFVNNSGTAVGSAQKYDGSFKGDRGVRWDGTGTADELGTLEDSGGFTYSQAYAINDSGTAIGRATKYLSGLSMGLRAVRWDAGGTATTELGNLGLDGSGSTSSGAAAINAPGTTVGYARKYDSGVDKGTYAVRWDAGGTVATELGHLGFRSDGKAFAQAISINNSGTVIGSSVKYTGGTDKGYRAARWDAGGTAITELGNLGLDGGGSTDARAYAINEAGTAVGYAERHGGGFSGDRAVRWDAGGTVATELANLGTNSGGNTTAQAFAVNEAGTAVGFANKFVSGDLRGSRAVRWDAGGTAATQLDNLGVNSFGDTISAARAVNIAGTAVGYADKYVGGSSFGRRATLWLPNASVIDLNDLGLMPVSGPGTWTLRDATSMSADGWVTGAGYFDADDTGPLGGWPRHWVTQVGLGGTWTAAFSGTLNGIWGRGPQWTTGTPAMDIGDATFSNSGTYTVFFDRDETTKNIEVTAGDVTFNQGSFSLTALEGMSVSSGAILRNAGELNVASGLTFQNAGEVVNNGTINTDTFQNDGTFRGEGTLIGNLIHAGQISPGNSPGEMTIDGNAILEGSSSYLLEIGDASGTSGSGWDLLSITGSALVTATVGDELLIDLTSLDSTNVPGEAMNFDSSQNYSWTFLRADGGFTGLDLDDFTVLTTNFQNALDGGTFSLLQDGNSLNLLFTAQPALEIAVVPEPASMMLLAIGGLVLLSHKGQRRR